MSDDHHSENGFVYLYITFAELCRTKPNRKYSPVNRPVIQNQKSEAVAKSKQELALISISARRSVSLVIPHSSVVRTVDWYLLIVRTQSMSMCVRIWEQTTLQTHTQHTNTHTHTHTQHRIVFSLNSTKPIPWYRVSCKNLLILHYW